MVPFVSSAGCKRAAILRHFGEGPAGECGDGDQPCCSCRDREHFQAAVRTWRRLERDKGGQTGTSEHAKCIAASLTREREGEP